MDESERWLERWHDRRPGATSWAFLRGKPSSYEWLAAHARSGQRVLDLACGDGALLEVMATRGVEGAVGIDMSEGELRAARARLGPGARLVQGRAQALPFEDASFDLVTCHLAFMLMRPAEDVLVEVRRVLRPGGQFAVIVSGALGAAEDAWSLLVRRLKQEPFEGPSIGDRRASSEDGLRALFAPFESVHVDRLRVDLSSTADEIIELLRLTYDAERLPPERLRALEDAVRADWIAITRPDGIVPCTFEFLGATASRPL